MQRKAIQKWLARTERYVKESQSAQVKIRTLGEVVREYVRERKLSSKPGAY